MSSSVRLFRKPTKNRLHLKRALEEAVREDDEAAKRAEEEAEYQLASDREEMARRIIALEARLG